MSWIILVFGLALLVFGANVLVQGAARLAENLGVPTLIVGLTVVAFGTSAPELAVSVKAAYSNQAELAVANVVGSNIFNILLVLGLAALISPLTISSQLIRRDVPVMIFASLVLVVLASSGSINRLESLLLISGLIAYITLLVKRSLQTEGATSDTNDKHEVNASASIWKNLFQVAGGFILIVLGARWLVEGGVEIATELGVSETVIGLTIIAAGTSMPEVVTSVVASIRGQRDIAVGNVVGSNIFNIFGVLGVSGLISPEPLLAGTQLSALDIPIMAGVAVLCLPLFYMGSKLNRIEGLIFLVLYVAYAWLLVAMAFSRDYAPTLKNGIGYGLVPLVLMYLVISLVRFYRKEAK